MSSINNTSTNATDSRLVVNSDTTADQSTGTGATDAAQASSQVQMQEADYKQRVEDESADNQRRQMLDGLGRNYGQSYGADDDESQAAASKIKGAVKKATGAVVTDKQLSAMHTVTANDPAMQKFSSQLASGQTPDVKEMYTAYQANPAAQAVNSGSAATGAATAASAGVINATAAGSAATGATQTGTSASSSDATSATSGATTISSSAQTDSTQTLSNSVDSTGSLSGGSWMTYVTMAMFNSTKELQSEKKDELMQIKKYNGMLDALNTYMSDTLMPAQQELQSKVAAKKGKNSDSLEVSINNPMTSLDTDEPAGVDSSTGKVVLGAAAGSKAWPVSEKVTQTQLTSMITQVDQWRTSIQNNQQIHSSNFQSLDTQLTSNLNQLPTLIKSFFETSQLISRNSA